MNNNFKKISISGIIVSIIATIISAYIVSYILSIDYSKPRATQDYIAIIALMLVTGALMHFGYPNYFDNDESDGKLKQLQIERVEINKKIEDKKDPDIFHTIQLSLNELTQYYTINKAQAMTSFRFSIVAIVSGLGIIITGIVLNYTGTKTIEVTYIAGVSGVLLEFIGGAYFFMYKKSLEQVNFFFGQLIKVQDTMLAINIAENIKDDSKKTDIQEKIILSLLERSLK